MKRVQRVSILLGFVLLLGAVGLSYLLLAGARHEATPDGGGSKAAPAIDSIATALARNSAPVLVGAGDIAKCGTNGAEATARLLDGIRGTVVALGDLAYDNGTARQFRNCYGPTWGRHKARTRPAPGNHEYNTSGAAPYYVYFGESAGEPGKGYYSYDVGSWHVVALNSNITAEDGSEQEKWLWEDLKASKAACTIAYWHHPAFSSGEHGSDPKMLDVWRTLYHYRADVVLNGHDHSYERFAPQDPNGKADPKRGIRQFVVGTGGANLRGFEEETVTNSEVRNSDTWGVLKLTLREDSYDWEFVPVEGKTFRDAGTGRCVR